MSVGQTTGETYLWKVTRGSRDVDVNEHRYARMADEIRAVVESRGLTYYSTAIQRQTYSHGGLMLQVKYVLEPGHTGPVSTKIAPPPPIADMAPGTTFRITDDEYEETWTVQYNQVAVCSTHGICRYLDVFTPSTIRDVTPPPKTPEAN